jgi:hypothetical protein
MQRALGVSLTAHATTDCIEGTAPSCPPPIPGLSIGFDIRGSGSPFEPLTWAEPKWRGKRSRSQVARPATLDANRRRSEPSGSDCTSGTWPSPPHRESAIWSSTPSREQFGPWTMLAQPRSGAQNFRQRLTAWRLAVQTDYSERKRAGLFSVRTLFGPRNGPMGTAI